jgi:hypothetical protein
MAMKDTPIWLDRSTTFDAISADAGADAAVAATDDQQLHHATS